MTILSLNLWGGRRFEKLMPFIREKAKEVDVFCFQEMIDGGPASAVTSLGVRGNLFGEMAGALVDFKGFKFLSPAPSEYHAEFAALGLYSGLAIFVRNNLKIVEIGEKRLYVDGLEDIRSTAFGTGDFQWAILEKDGKCFGVGNVHGLILEFRPTKPGKRDTVERIEQSHRLVEFLNRQNGRGIIIGDHNLMPDTESVAMLAGAGKNLIVEYGITNTRNFEYPYMEKYRDYISDYAFAGNNLTIIDFKVLPDIVSDHAALFLVIE